MDNFDSKNETLIEIDYSEVSWVTDYEFEVRIEKILIARWRIQDV